MLNYAVVLYVNIIRITTAVSQIQRAVQVKHIENAGSQKSQENACSERRCSKGTAAPGKHSAISPLAPPHTKGVQDCRLTGFSKIVNCS